MRHSTGLVLLVIVAHAAMVAANRDEPLLTATPVRPRLVLHDTRVPHLLRLGVVARGPSHLTTPPPVPPLAPLHLLLTTQHLQEKISHTTDLQTPAALPHLAPMTPDLESAARATLDPEAANDADPWADKTAASRDEDVQDFSSRMWSDDADTVVDDARAGEERAGKGSQKRFYYPSRTRPRIPPNSRTRMHLSELSVS